MSDIVEKQEEPGLAELVKDWSEQDKNWLNQQPMKFRKCAASYGRPLYDIVMRAGMCTFMLTQLYTATKDPRIQQMLRDLTAMLDYFCKGSLVGIDKTVEDFSKCKHDIELIMTLSNGGQVQPGDRVSPGGLILHS